MAGPTTAAAERASRQQALALKAAAAADDLWQYVNGRRITASWRLIADRLVTMMMAAQLAAAQGAQEYVTQSVEELGGSSDPVGRVNPSAFAGWAADGRSLASLLELPRITALTAISAGMPEGAALQAGRAQLLRIASSEVADAGRSASGVAIASNRTCTGYVRVIAGGACSRCVVLAGVVYGSAVAFQRHPHCHCVHQPAIRGDRRPIVTPNAYFNQLSRVDQDRVFGVAGARAIRDGGDIFAIVNARRGMYTTTAYGRQVRATSEGTTRRGAFYQAERRRAVAAGQATRSNFRLRTPRLLPEEIYVLADSQAEVMALLQRFGYLR
ncbi:hypothetical protein ABZS83_33030 [Streptomyces sp. NPDC005426]|uniref:VG15 protein n=1 Tax=Streptomyces sp. NPDC005426 TaxID=3155344 RepID=UPI0033B38896